MFCFFCKEKLHEDNSICSNKFCEYLTEKLKEHGLLQFYLRTFNALEKPSFPKKYLDS
jgi:predicted nucleic acid-binding Zn ribbon protein